MEYEGRIPVKVNLHRAAFAAFEAEGKSLDAWVAETIERAIP